MTEESSVNSTFEQDIDPGEELRWSHWKNADFYSAQDDRLSVASVGVMFYLISKPKGWSIRYADLQKRFGLGRKAMRTITRELMKCGYLEGRVVGQKGYRWTWRTRPRLDGQPFARCRDDPQP